MAKRGRPKRRCLLGEPAPHCFWLYPIEFEKLKIEFNKLKKQRSQYYVKEKDND